MENGNASQLKGNEKVIIRWESWNKSEVVTGVESEAERGTNDFWLFMVQQD
jgi:hypothetical protein